MNPSYDKQQIEDWLKKTPEERLLEAEELWKEFLIKYPHDWKPFHKSFSSFKEYHRWLEEQKNPILW